MGEELKMTAKHVPETRVQEDEREKRERMMDKTLEDSYPASDPPSSIPDPEGDSEAA